MTAVLARTPAQIAETVVRLVADFEVGPLDLHHDLANDWLLDNEDALVAWRKWTTACVTLWTALAGGGRHSVEPVASSDIVALAECQSLARARLLESVVIPADVDMLRRAAVKARKRDYWTWFRVATWFEVCASDLATASRLGDLENWPDVDDALNHASVMLGEPRAKVTLR